MFGRLKRLATHHTDYDRLPPTPSLKPSLHRPRRSVIYLTDQSMSPDLSTNLADFTQGSDERYLHECARDATEFPTS